MEATVITEVDKLCQRSMDTNLSPHELTEIHTYLAGYRHTMGTYMVDAEEDHAKKKEAYMTHCIKSRLLMQLQDNKLSTAKATDRIEGEVSTELMRLEIIEAEAKYKRMKQRLATSNDVLISISIRLGIAKQEMINLHKEYNNG